MFNSVFFAQEYINTDDVLAFCLYLMNKMRKCGGDGVKMSLLTITKTVLKQKVDAGSMEDRCRVEVGSMWRRQNKNKKQN